MIVDMEAGLEHLSLQTTENADWMLVVAEPFHQSLQTAAIAYQMAVENGIPQVVMILNKIRDDRDYPMMDVFCQKRGLKTGAVLPNDPALVEASQIPAAPIDYCPQSKAVLAIAKLGEIIKNRFTERVEETEV